MLLLLLFGTVMSSSVFSELFFFNPFGNCTENQYVCKNSKCIPSSLRCNGKNDCGDASDEKNCELYLCNDSKYFRCKNKRCIAKSFVCDGENDCEDFSDEKNCESFKHFSNVSATCQEGHWQCSDKLCIPNEWVCNGEEDCLDGSDEGIGCSSKIECDGFKCKNGHCLPNEWVCDGHDDCHDNSDEVDCENHVPIHKCTLDNRKFLCSDNKTCIDLKHACDGHLHCPDKSDESSLCTLPSLSCKKHGCSDECVQLPKGPRCICPIGYHNIDEKHCEDINECKRFDICDQKCRNTAGSYECYCDDRYFLKKDKKQCKVIGGEALMVFSSKTEIRAFSLGTEHYFPVAKNLKQVVGVEYNGNHVYWTDIHAEHESIVRSLEDGSEREILVTSGLGLPEDLSVDWLTGNIYFTDAEKQHIGVCTSSGYVCTVLVNKDIRKPRGIVLNVNDGDMYWTDWGKPAEIVYAMMDGSHDKPFVSSDIHWPNGLALDYHNDRLYWTDARKMSLESIKLDGTDRRVVLQGVVKHPYAIAVFEDKLYWSDWATHSIESCNKFSGKDHRTIAKEEKEYIYGISIFHSALHTRKDNPCLLALCSDMCLLKGSSYSCACPQNKVLGQDAHVCQNVGPKQMLIVGYKNRLIHVEHQFLGKHDMTSMPTVAKNVGCLTYNMLENSILISDLDTKKIINLNLNSGLSKPLDISELGRVIAMDFDGRGNNLYLCDQDRSVLEVVDLNTMARKILIHDMFGEIIEAVALVPEEGVMFVAFRNKNEHTSHIDRFYMDGTLRTHSKDHGLIGPISLHYDENLHVVFYADAETGDIESTSVEGDDRHIFRTLATHPVGLTSLNNDLFWVNEHSRRLYWAEKQGYSNYNKKISLDLPDEPERLHIVSVTPRLHLASPCHMNNNGCSHLCLMSQKTVICSCPSGWELSGDNRTCIKRAHCLATEFLCVGSNRCILKHSVCDGHKDCADGEDELECRTERKCEHGLFQCKNGDCIEQANVCDGKYDCTDKSDERNCDRTNTKTCPPQHFRCTNGTCIAERFFCDGIQDCNDNSDESNCHSNTCAADQFRCDSGNCIPSTWECDHDYDCTDFSDEHANCASASCRPSMFSCSNGKCIENSLICDDADDCGDNSDEISCYQKRTDNCGPEEFPCGSNNSICLPIVAKCNNTSECPKGEDETGCSLCVEQEFSCQNKGCVPMQWVCDGRDDCGDNSDEDSGVCSRKHDNGTDLTVSEMHALCEHGYRCKTGDCIDLERVCDGNHDCYDGSDEDGLCSKACLEKNPCSQKCIKTPHGAMCTCKPGYKLMGDGYSCTDIDECSIEPAVCSQLCHNDEGGYTCDCYQKFVLRTDKSSCKAEGHPLSFLFTTDGQIRELSQKTSSLSVLYSERTPKLTGLESLSQPLTVYFCMEAASTIQKIDVKTQTLHYMEDVGRPQKLAVDWATNNIYYYNSESQSKSISVCNFEEKFCAKLIDIDIHRQVSAVAVDSVNQALFYALSSWWVFNSPSYTIYKCNLDGTGRTELQQTTTGYINALTFDYNKRQLFYTDQHASQIKSMSYDGKSKTTIFPNITRSVGLRFFENHLFYLTRGGNVNKCKLYGDRKCDAFRLHSYSSDLFTVIQDTLQPFVRNPCEKHSCSYLCLLSGEHYKCLCKDGSVVARSEKCSEKSEKISNNDGREYKVHSVPVKLKKTEHKKSSVILTAILVPLFLISLAATLVYVIRKRQSSDMNIRMRFYNSTYDNRRDDLNKPILIPGQHEYSNPVHFERGDGIPTNGSPKKVHFDCV